MEVLNKGQEVAVFVHTNIDCQTKELRKAITGLCAFGGHDVKE
jgi:hypothetical protein